MGIKRYHYVGVSKASKKWKLLFGVEGFDFLTLSRGFLGSWSGLAFWWASLLFDIAFRVCGIGVGFRFWGVKFEVQPFCPSSLKA